MGRFPEPGDEELLAGPSGNFQILDPLDFLAEVTQHIPDPGLRKPVGFQPTRLLYNIDIEDMQAKSDAQLLRDYAERRDEGMIQRGTGEQTGH